jgi:DNA-3-methyladenine glycosylase
VRLVNVNPRADRLVKSSDALGLHLSWQARGSKVIVEIRTMAARRATRSVDGADMSGDKRPSMARKRAGRKLTRTFFARDAIEVAPDLIGKILVHRLRGNELKARIVETEAYVGPHDLACHASKGRTGRTEVMFGRAGHAYVYLIYGMYQMLNIVTGEKGDAQAVLIRAGEALDGWEADLSGPGKFARAMRISRSQNGLDMTGGELFLLDDPADRPQVVRSKRVGVDYAKEWRDELLRFSDAASVAVSKPRPLITVANQAKRF